MKDSGYNIRNKKDWEKRIVLVGNFLIVSN